MAALDNLVFRNWSQNDKTNSLSARLYNGSISFTVFPRQGGNKPLAKIAFDQAGDAYRGFIKIAKDVMASPMGKKVSMSRTQFNPATKQRGNIWTITIEKDSEMCYKLYLTDVQNGGASFTFTLMGSQNIVVGAEPPSRSQLSERAMLGLLDWMQQAHQYGPLTADKGFKGGPRPGSTPASAAVAPSVAGDVEDPPF